MEVSAVNSRQLEVEDTHYCLRRMFWNEVCIASVDRCGESVSRPSVETLEMNWYLGGQVFSEDVTSSFQGKRDISCRVATSGSPNVSPLMWADYLVLPRRAMRKRRHPAILRECYYLRLHPE